VYVENVRNALYKLSIEDRAALAKKTKDILVKRGKIKNSVRPAEIEKYLKNFLDGKETNIKYFEGFLEALDEMYPNGAEGALLGVKVKKEKTWRNILLNITKEVPSPKLQKYSDNEFIIKELKTLFIGLSERTIGIDVDDTLIRLRALNQLFQINDEGKKDR